jgi:5-methylcytosine-specific restriction endonuclease McrA
LTKRKSFSRSERVRLFELHKGICHICEHKIDGVREKWEVEHVIPFEMTRDNSNENCKPAHVICHKGKTKQDVKDIAKCKRREAAHIGAKPKSKAWGNSKYKKKLDGTVVLR